MRSLRLQLLALAMFVAVAHATESGGELELDQADAYDVSRGRLNRDFTDLIQEAETANAMPATAPKAKQVKIVGDTAIDATLRMFAEGGDILQVTDSSNGYGVAIGTNTQQKDHIRLKPTEGEGIAINSKADKVGLFVDAKSGFVGVGHSKPVSHLHVKGTMHATGTITTTAKGDKAALQLSGVEDFKGIQLNTDGNGLYLIGRGKALAEREMSFHVPSASDYGGGKEPKFVWASGSAHETVATLESSTGNMYLKGKMGIGAMEPKAALDVRGGLNLENERGEAIITFPRGKGTGFHIRSTDTPGTYNPADDRLFIKGDNGFVGIQTTEPKAMLDVRGAINLQDALSSAVIYFPSNGFKSGFYIRCADNPSQYSRDQERFFIGADGKVGIGTNTPTHGLTINSEEAEGSKKNDIAIMKGNLHLYGAIYDTFGGGKKYFMDLKQGSYLKSVNVETMLGVGTSKPTGIPGSDSVIHIQGNSPVMRVENTKAEGSAALSLQTGSNHWDVEGSTGFFTIKNNGKSRITIADDGKIGIGEKATEPEYGLQIETDAPEGNPMNDLAIRKGNLWMSGAIKKIGNPKYSFSLDQGGLVKQLSVEGNVGIGLAGESPKFALQLAETKTMSIGDQLFFTGANGKAYVSGNAYQAEGKWALHKAQDGASAMTLENTGTIILSATKKAGEPLLETMLSLDAKTQSATFPMQGLKTGFGTKDPQYPLQVNGGTAVGMTKASLAFGMAETAMGYLGSNDKYVYIATSSGREVLALDHGTGYVGIGTGAPKSTLHLASAESPSMSFGSTALPDTHAYIKAVPDGEALNMIFGVTNPGNAGGKLSFDFTNEIKFEGAGPTIFSRGDTLFKSGNVGIGGSSFDKEFRLHVKGDMKIDGKCYVAGKKPSTGGAAPAAAPAEAKEEGADAPAAEGADAPAEPAAEPADAQGGAELNELDFTDLLEEAEGSNDHLSEHGIDLGEALHGLTRVLRKQHRQMDTHDQRIGELRQQLSELMAR